MNKPTENERMLLRAKQWLERAEDQVEHAANSLLDAQIEVTIQEKRVAKEQRDETRTS